MFLTAASCLNLNYRSSLSFVEAFVPFNHEEVCIYVGVVCRCHKVDDTNFRSF